MIPTSFNIDFFVLVVIGFLGILISVKSIVLIFNFYTNKFLRKKQKIKVL